MQKLEKADNLGTERVERKSSDKRKQNRYNPSLKKKLKTRVKKPLIYKNKLKNLVDSPITE